MTATVRPGIYLEDHPPARRQYLVGRRRPGIRPVIVVHTAESGTDQTGPDPKAEGVADYIRTRSTAGSYHLIGDVDSIIQLIRFENEAAHDGTGSNRWAISISLAMNAADWPVLPEPRRLALLDTAGLMAAIGARWFIDQGHEPPRSVLLSKSESDRADANGFISHARRDPTRRSDPGRDFPWHLFFDRYQHHLGRTTDMPDRTEQIKTAQRAIAEAGYATAWFDDSDPTRRVEPGYAIEVDDYADGDFGPTTLADLEAALADLNEAEIDPAIVAKAQAYERVRAAAITVRSIFENPDS